MACHRAVVTAPGPGRTALRAASLPCGNEAAGGGRVQAEPARAGADCGGGGTATLLGNWHEAARSGLASECSCLRLLVLPLAGRD